MGCGLAALGLLLAVAACCWRRHRRKRRAPKAGKCEELDGIQLQTLGRQYDISTPERKDSVLTERKPSASSREESVRCQC